MSIDPVALFSVIGSPTGYVVVGFALYKVWQAVQDTKRSAQIANHNSTILVKALLKHNLIDPDEIKDVELDDD